MRRAVVRLDFVPQLSAARVAGFASAGIGALACVLVFADYAHLANVRDTLQTQRDSLLSAVHRVHRAPPLADAHKTDVGRMTKSLSLPWSELLSELEAAAADEASDVSVLGVEPDSEKKVVHVLGEARSFPAALAFVRRLQRSAALRYPMLDSHEVREQDAEHPVRFRMTAEWRVGS